MNAISRETPKLRLEHFFSMSNLDVLIEIIMGFLMRISDVLIKIWAFPILSHPDNLEPVHWHVFHYLRMHHTLHQGRGSSFDFLLGWLRPKKKKTEISWKHATRSFSSLGWILIYKDGVERNFILKHADFFLFSKTSYKNAKIHELVKKLCFRKLDIEPELLDCWHPSRLQRSMDKLSFRQCCARRILEARATVECQQPAKLRASADFQKRHRDGSDLQKLLPQIRLRLQGHNSNSQIIFLLRQKY